MNLSALSELDTERFTAEDVAQIFGMSLWMAKRCCETAVRQGTFERVDDPEEIVYRLKKRLAN